VGALKDLNISDEVKCVLFGRLGSAREWRIIGRTRQQNKQKKKERVLWDGQIVIGGAGWGGERRELVLNGKKSF